jgi:hypothetical protein
MPAQRHCGPYSSYPSSRSQSVVWRTLRHAPPVRHPLLYRGAIVRGRDRVFRALLPGACAALVLGGCGGGGHQDAHEPAGSFAMKLVHASFPARQSITHMVDFKLQVRNTGAHTAPNVAVTLDSFYYTSTYPEQASDKRPVWIVEQGPGAIGKPAAESEAVNPPGSGQTAYVNTWALGPLAPGHTRTFVWRVTPVKAGRHTVHFTVAAGLAGKAKARLASGAPVQGSLTATIAPVPAIKHVDPNTGRIVSGSRPLTP